MRIHTKAAGTAAALCLMAAPAFAANPHSGTDNPGTSHHSATPGPHASLPAKAKAYGRYCKAESKKHSDAAAGTKGTPFSQCVTAMAKLANGKTDSPREACKGLSKKHSDAAPGTHGTPFSQCVSGAAKLKHDQDDADADQQSGDDSTSTEGSEDQAPTS